MMLGVMLATTMVSLAIFYIGVKSFKQAILGNICFFASVAVFLTGIVAFARSALGVTLGYLHLAAFVLGISILGTVMMHYAVAQTLRINQNTVKTWNNPYF